MISRSGIDLGIRLTAAAKHKLQNRVHWMKILVLSSGFGKKKKNQSKVKQTNPLPGWSADGEGPRRTGLKKKEITARLSSKKRTNGRQSGAENGKTLRENRSVQGLACGNTFPLDKSTETLSAGEKSGC